MYVSVTRGNNMGCIDDFRKAFWADNQSSLDLWLTKKTPLSCTNNSHQRSNQELLAEVKESEEMTNSLDSDIIRVQSGSWDVRFMVRRKRFFFSGVEKEAVRSCFLGRDVKIASALASRPVGRVRPSAMAPNWPAPRQKDKQTPQALT